MKDIKNIYFIGIGGVGMSGIALVAKAQGLEVSGSDIRQSRLTSLLEDNGIHVNIGQVATNITQAEIKPDLVVISTAILENNQELKAAKELGIEIWHRAQMLAFLGRDLDTLAVAGTHGKTSTSSMLASVLYNLDCDPTFLIGGVLKDFSTNARCGTGNYYVVEADESDKSFKYITPSSAIITNIEADHLDHYKDLDEIYEKFTDFIDSVKDSGVVVVCGDDKKLKEIAQHSGKKVITYGFDKDCDCVVDKFKSSGMSCSFTLKLNGNKYKVELNHTPGEHYCCNAAGVLALLDYCGYDIKKAVSALANFGGIKRRFEYVGNENDITVCDDYAHHPTEIASTIKAALNLGYKNVHAIWQPHRYSRVNLICDIYKDKFAHAFDGCDTIASTNVYAAGETPVPGVNGQMFLNVVLDGRGDNNKADKAEITYLENTNSIPDYCARIAKPGDLVIIMGAGDITFQGPLILKKIKDEVK